MGLTLTVFLGSVFLVPRAWINGLFSPLNLTTADLTEPGRPWLEIMPPPTVVTATPIVPPEKPAQQAKVRVWSDPRWWLEGWAIRADADVARQPVTDPRDRVAIQLEFLGRERDFAARVRTDSLLASRLWILRQEESFMFEELKSSWYGLARKRAYAHIRSREADMYDEHLSARIMVPD